MKTNKNVSTIRKNKKRVHNLTSNFILRNKIYCVKMRLKTDFLNILRVLMTIRINKLIPQMKKIMTTLQIHK